LRREITLPKNEAGRVEDSVSQGFATGEVLLKRASNAPLKGVAFETDS
jgi:hypothetical protein